MDRYLKSREVTEHRLRWLILLRLGIAFFLLAVAFFIQTWGSAFLSEEALAHFFKIIFIIAILSGCYLIILRFDSSPRINVYIQALLDVAIVTWLVFATGGIQSNYPVFYPLVIIYSVLFLERYGGFIIASASAISYGLLLDLEFFRIIIPTGEDAISAAQLSAIFVFTRLFVHIISFYIIALLASFVVARERETRLLLLERETALDQLDQLHKSIIESVDVGIVTVNLLGRIKSFNRAATDITGIPFSRADNRDVRKIFPRFNDISRNAEEEAEDPARATTEIIFEKSGNGEMVLECFHFPLKDHVGERVGSILIFRDITSVKKMEEEYEKNRRLAVIGEMASGLAHEMRTPLASISGSIQVLKKGMKLGPSDERLMQIILRGKDQLENFMRDFLMLARPSPGVSEVFDIRSVIIDVLDTIRYMPDWKDSIIISSDMRKKTIIRANKTEIRQVLWNLLLNAVQAMPEGGKLGISAVRARRGDRNEWVEICITDTGMGIPKENLVKVFEPFFTTKEKGTGLGLTVVNRIIEGSGGKITLDSSLEQGTVCMVILPAEIIVQKELQNSKTFSNEV
ncbi:MAG: ATP-binding protein [Syntrophales bacterium]|jgi:two-component system sensor histidine kinase PilS (NtrC family)